MDQSILAGPFYTTPYHTILIQMCMRFLKVRVHSISVTANRQAVPLIVTHKELSCMLKHAHVTSVKCHIVLLPLVQDDPLLRVWDSMHRAMLLALAALQSLPIRPHPQHPDPAATTHTSATTQLPPGYHRCSACLLLSLRLAICLAQHCEGNALEGSQTMAQLHATLPGLLLGLSTSVTVMQAAGHPEAQAQRVLLTRLLLFLGALLLVVKNKAETRPEDDIDTWLAKKVTTSCPDHLARLLARSPAVTGWPGPLPAKPSPLNSSSTARGSSSKGGGSSKRRQNHRILDPASWNSFAHVAQAMCAVLGRQEEGLIMDQLISTCKAEGR
ncbi:hypothetical protein V8C86DRAFT_1681179 [Haematococcus lacustris]